MIPINVLNAIGSSMALNKQMISWISCENLNKDYLSSSQEGYLVNEELITDAYFQSNHCLAGQRYEAVTGVFIIGVKYWRPNMQILN